MSVSERSRRVARRQGEVSAFTRQQALTALGSCATVDECVKWTEHANKHVRKAAKARIDRLENPPKVEEKKSIIVDTSSPGDAMFAQLVEKFRQAGKKDPVKSAHASVAASAQAAKRRAAAANAS